MQLKLNTMRRPFALAGYEFLIMSGKRTNVGCVIACSADL